MDKICSVEGCNRKHCAKGYCQKHYNQMRKKGYIYEQEEQCNINKIEIYETYAKLIIKNTETYIDIEDIDKISLVIWHISDKGYVRNTKLGRLHRYITNCPDDMVVDHINGNRLDNRKCNLRICTHSENNANRKPKENRSLPKGVVKKGNRYRAYITHNKERMYLGSYKTIEEAQKAYKEKSQELYGDFTYDNSQEIAEINDIDIN
jgi:hypothetical protein